MQWNTYDRADLLARLQEKCCYVFGDSLSKGIIFDAETRKYEISPAGYITLLEKQTGFQIKNFASFGATIRKGLAVLSRHEQKLRGNSLALLEFGGNDCDFLWARIAENPEGDFLSNTPLDEFQTSYQALIRRLKGKNILPVIMSLPPLDADRFFETCSKNLNKDNILRWLGGTTMSIYQWHESYNAVLATLAQSEGVPYLDVRENFLLQKNPSRFLCADGMHPNEEGHRLMAASILRILHKENLLRA